MQIEKVEHFKNNETVKVHFLNNIDKGLVKLKIEFSGILNENYNGFYKAKCINRDNTEGYSAVTQFEVIEDQFKFYLINN